ncbi:IS66-like element accessory protein TnpA [Bradyrhizobium sp. SZCCHNS1054]|uniref:IS66-like element accessory protein TnpA n=1 Tax=Bradyrhizobium sp. SZCCHNS1054 TaxID=3057301 RepID=UPI002916521B|nr:transposase [Bradyrhizobium sp. SZCCHNS1054]
MDTERNAITEPARRLEVFTGRGRRRRWSDEDKARIVAETVGDSACAVARRHGLLPQQVFGWRRQLRDAADSQGSEVDFVPAVIAAGTSASDRQWSAASGTDFDVAGITLEVDGVTIRAGRSADAAMIAAIVRALKANR